MTRPKVHIHDYGAARIPCSNPECPGEPASAAGSRSEGLDVQRLGQAMEQRGIRVSRADVEDIARRYRPREDAP